MLLALFFSAAINWNADLDVLQREIPNVHPNAFHATTREAFDAAIAKLRASTASMPPNVVVAEMTRIVASIGDGHTRLTIPIDPKAGFFTGHSPTNIPDDPALHFRALPVRFTWFSDGVFITSAANEDLIGKRVTTIGSMKIDDAINSMAPLAHADNDAMRRLVITEYLAVPELLNAVGIAPSSDRVAVNGVMLDAVPFGAEVPWLEKADSRTFWFEPRGKIVYAVINQIANGEHETLAAFCDRLFEYINEHHSDALILDLRANPGGNSAFNKALVHGLIRNPKLPVFVLIGRRTFSAAVTLATELEQNTSAIFVGEPTGGRPNGFGDSRKIALPSSGLTVRVATLYHQESDPRDSRDAIPPHLTVSPSSADFLAHRDLVLQTAMHVAEAMRKKGTLDGNWTGIITIDWKRIPITITDHQVTLPDLAVKSAPIPQSKFTVDSAEGPLQFDLKVGDGVIAGTMTAQGRTFPVLITRRASEGRTPSSAHAEPR
jgi:hypothetical protein